jgi:hypothetical protein
VDDRPECQHVKREFTISTSLGFFSSPQLLFTPSQPQRKETKTTGNELASRLVGLTLSFNKESRKL